MNELARLADLETEVHVQCVELTATRETIERVLSILSSAERERASRFYFQHISDRFILARAALRALLGRYLSVSPEHLEFEYGPQGKPLVTLPKTGLEFNLSHSGAFAAYAFTMAREVGIDIEQIRPMRDCEAIARRFFGESECADLFSLPEPERTAAFYRCWVRKEAYIKALGGGLSIPLDSFRVSLKPGERPALLEVRGAAPEAQHWAMHEFYVAPNLDGAITFRDATKSVRVTARLTAEELLRDIVK